MWKSSEGRWFAVCFLSFLGAFSQEGTAQPLRTAPVPAPEEAEVHEDEVRSLLESGRYKEAISLARQVLAQERDSGRPAVAAHLQGFGSALSSCGQYSEARPFLERAVEIEQGTQARDGSAQAASLTELAHLLVNIGDFRAAADRLETAISLVERQAGGESKVYADALSIRGALYLSQGRDREAQSIVENALAIRRRLGLESDVARSLTQLAQLFSEQRERARARPLIDESIAILERTLGPRHPALVPLLILLTWSRIEERENIRAQALVDRQLEIAESACGPESPLAVPALFQRAQLHMAAHETSAARADADRALSIQEGSIGATSPRLSAWLRIQGDLLKDTGDAAGAEKALRRSIEVASVPGGEVLAAAGMNSLAVFLVHGRPEEAKALLERSLAIFDASLGPENVLSLADLLLLVGFAQPLQEDSERIAPLLERAIPLAEKVYGPDDLGAARMRLQWVPILLGRGETWLAETEASKALLIFERKLGPANADLAKPLVVLGKAETAKGDFDSAGTHLDRAVALLRGRFGEEHPATATVRVDLAQLLEAQGDLAGAGAIYESAISVLQAHLGAGHPAVAQAIAGSASVALQAGRLGEAARLYDRAIEALEQAPGAPPGALAPLLASRAEIYRAEGQLGLAEAAFGRARESLGFGSKLVLSTQIDAGLASVLAEKGQTAEARKLIEGAVHAVEKRAGGESPDLLEALQTQGTIYLDQGAYDEAAAAFERAYGIIEKRWGADYYLAGHSLIGRGMVQEVRGELAAARASYEAALSLWQKTLGPLNPNVAVALEHVGEMARHRGDFNAAEDAFRRALEIQKAVAGARHPAVGQALLALGNVRSERGDYPAARALIEESLGMTEEAYGPTYFKLAAPLNSFGSVLRAQGRYREAVAALGRARKLLEEAGRTDLPDYALVIENLGECLVEMGRYSEARPLLERTLEILRERRGPTHPEVARGLEALGSLLLAEGDYNGGRRLYETALEILARAGEVSPEHTARIEMAFAPLLTEQGEYIRALHLTQDSIKILREVLRPEHPDVGDALRGLGDMLALQGDTPAAINAYRSALAVTESALGAGHPRVGLVLRGLGSALICKGDWVAARATLERARSILEPSLGPDHPVVGAILSQLGQLRIGQGDVEIGEALTSRAAEIFAASLGPDHPGLISILSELVVDKSLLLRPAESSALLDRVSQIEAQRERESGISSSGLLCRIASAQAATARSESAKATYERALEVLRESGRASRLEALGPLMGQGYVSLKTGDYKTARASYLAAERIAEKELGGADPRLAAIVGNLGFLDWHDGQRASARRKLLRASDILWRGTETLLPSLSFAEQRAFLGTPIGYPAPYLLSFFKEGADLRDAVARVFPMKGMLVESLRREAALTRAAGHDPSMAPWVDRLHQLRTEISGLQAAHAPSEGDARQRRLLELSGEKEQMERELGKLAPGKGLADPMKGMGLRDIRRLLGPEEAIVDVYRYEDVSGDKPLDQYGAVVISARRDPLLIRLGSVAELHSALQYWRSLVLFSRSDVAVIDSAWRTLADLLWKPIAAALPPAARRIWLSPDDELSRIPWQLVPSAETGSSALLVTQIDSVRELVRLKETAPGGGGGQPTALIAGGIDFDTGAGEQGRPYAPVPATLIEARAIRDLGLREGLDASLLVGAEARKDEILRRLTQADYVHLATHGFFATSTTPSANSADFFAAFGRLRDSWGDPWTEVLSRTRNPLAESGIALAGANGRPSAAGESVGVLTAEELIGIDLSRVRLVTLSACETGRGEEATGQGVLGLRAAFLAAGARSLVMSLWKVPDEATQELMRRFYVNLWQRKLPRLEALLQAQKALRDDPSLELRSPLSWAGWILVGEAW